MLSYLLRDFVSGGYTGANNYVYNYDYSNAPLFQQITILIPPTITYNGGFANFTIGGSSGASGVNTYFYIYSSNQSKGIIGEVSNYSNLTSRMTIGFRYGETGNITIMGAYNSVSGTNIGISNYVWTARII
jgi:hypothetical protein